MDKETLKRFQEWQQAGREALSASPQSVDAEKRTVDVCWFSGADVTRYDWMTGEPYILRFDPSGADLSNLNNGAPVLDSHSGWSTSSQLGKVEQAWSEGGKYLGKLRFSRRSEVDGTWQDIQDGILSKFSMGVEILQYEDTPKTKDGKPRVRLATQWRPFEISVVPIPADFNTSTLAAQAAPAADLGAQAQKEHEMNENLNPAAEAPTPEPVVLKPENPVDTEKLRREAVETERQRISAIHERCRVAGLPAEFAQKLVADGVELSAAADRIFAEMERLSTAQQAIRPHVEVTRDAGVTMREAMSNAILHNYDQRAFALDKGREFMGLRLMDLARECLSAKGVSHRGLPISRVAELALTTSDLPNILADVANKTLRQAYEASPRTFTAWARQVSAPDFKNINRIQLSENPQLEKVNEHGEFKYGSVSDAKETYKLATYGKIVSITRQTIINDDMSALTRIPAGYGVAAATLESDTVYGILTANAAMADSVALFHASHSNLLTGAGTALSASALGSAIASMMKTKGVDGKTIINVMPQTLIVPVALRFTAEQIIGSTINPALSSNAVPAYIRALQPVAEPRLDANSTAYWYLAASPSQIDTVEFCYLQGNSGVYLEQRMGFEVDGVEFKARLDFAAAAIDYRGLQRNNGA